MICNKCGVTGDWDYFYRGNPTICKDCFKKRNAAWQAKNPAKVRANASKAAALARGAFECTCCKSADFLPIFQKAVDTGLEVDHKLSCKEGGKHCVQNLQLLTREQNLLKGGR